MHFRTKKSRIKKKTKLPGPSFVQLREARSCGLRPWRSGPWNFWQCSSQERATPPGELHLLRAKENLRRGGNRAGLSSQCWRWQLRKGISCTLQHLACERRQQHLYPRWNAVFIFSRNPGIMILSPSSTTATSYFAASILFSNKLSERALDPISNCTSLMLALNFFSASIVEDWSWSAVRKTSNLSRG